MTRFHFTKEPSTGSYIITAFQTVGYISVLAVRYLEEKGALKQIGYFELETDAPVAIINNGEISFPIRILEGGGAIFITSEVPLPQKAINVFIPEIFDLYKKYSSKGIIALDGLAIEKGKETSDVYFVSNKKDMNIPDTKKLEEGAMVGLNAALILAAKATKTPVTVIMAETHSEIPDGLAAAALIATIGKLTSLKVDTTELVSEYKKTLSKINDMLKRVVTQKEEKPQGSDIYG
jgi:predicted ATP-grasp superfamily ATP-dependent carboligase